MNLVTGISKCLQLIVTGSELINEVDRVIESREFVALTTVSLATRTTLLFLRIAEIAFAASNSSRSSAAVSMNNAECVIRLFVNTPIQAIEACHVLADGQASTLTKMKAVEKKILGSLLGLIRVAAEADLLTQQGYRDLPPEEQAKIQFPIYKLDPDAGDYGPTHKIVGYRPFDLKECLENISKLEKAIPKLNVVEMAAEMSVGSKVLGISKAAFDLLVRWVSAHPGAAHVVTPHVAAPPGSQAAPQQQGVEEDPDNFFDLSRLNFIPVELDEDPFFRQFTCPITTRPIRYIVADPTTGNRVYYERSAVEGWLATSQTSPATRQFLVAPMLTPCTGIQAAIDERLALYSQRVREEIQEMTGEPINQEEIDNIIEEERGVNN